MPEETSPITEQEALQHVKDAVTLIQQVVQLASLRDPTLQTNKNFKKFSTSLKSIQNADSIEALKPLLSPCSKHLEDFLNQKETFITDEIHSLVTQTSEALEAITKHLESLDKTDTTSTQGDDPKCTLDTKMEKLIGIAKKTEEALKKDTASSLYQSTQTIVKSLAGLPLDCLVLELSTSATESTSEKLITLQQAQLLQQIQALAQEIQDFDQATTPAVVTEKLSQFKTSFQTLIKEFLNDSPTKTALSNAYSDAFPESKHSIADLLTQMEKPELDSYDALLQQVETLKSQAEHITTQATKIKEAAQLQISKDQQEKSTERTASIPLTDSKESDITSISSQSPTPEPRDETQSATEIAQQYQLKLKQQAKDARKRQVTTAEAEEQKKITAQKTIARTWRQYRARKQQTEKRQVKTAEAEEQAKEQEKITAQHAQTDKPLPEAMVLQRPEQQATTSEQKDAMNLFTAQSPKTDKSPQNVQRHAPREKYDSDIELKEITAAELKERAAATKLQTLTSQADKSPARVKKEPGRARRYVESNDNDGTELEQTRAELIRQGKTSIRQIQEAKREIDAIANISFRTTQQPITDEKINEIVDDIDLDIKLFNAKYSLAMQTTIRQFEQIDAASTTTQKIQSIADELQRYAADAEKRAKEITAQFQRLIAAPQSPKHKTVTDTKKRRARKQSDLQIISDDETKQLEKELHVFQKPMDKNFGKPTRKLNLATQIDQLANLQPPTVLTTGADGQPIVTTQEMASHSAPQPTTDTGTISPGTPRSTTPTTTPAAPRSSRTIDEHELLEALRTNKHKDALDLLITSPCGIHYQDKIERTPLHWAVEQLSLTSQRIRVLQDQHRPTTEIETIKNQRDQYLLIIKLLLSRGADPTIKDKYGQTPLGLMVSRQFPAEARDQIASFIRLRRFMDRYINENGTPRRGLTYVELLAFEADVDALREPLKAFKDQFSEEQRAEMQMPADFLKAWKLLNVDGVRNEFKTAMELTTGYKLLPNPDESIEPSIARMSTGQERGLRFFTKAEFENLKTVSISVPQENRDPSKPYAEAFLTSPELRPGQRSSIEKSVLTIQRPKDIKSDEEATKAQCNTAPSAVVQALELAINQNPTNNNMTRYFSGPAKAVATMAYAALCWAEKNQIALTAKDSKDNILTKPGLEKYLTPTERKEIERKVEVTSRKLDSPDPKAVQEGAKLTAERRRQQQAAQQRQSADPLEQTAATLREQQAEVEASTPLPRSQNSAIT